MAAESRGSLTLPVLLVGLVLGLLGAVCHGGVIQHGGPNHSPQHPDSSSSSRALQVARHLTRAISESPAERRWKTLGRRLNIIRHMTRPGRAVDEDLSPQNNPSTARKRRAIGEEHQHERAVSKSSPAGHWRRLSRRLNTVQRLMRSRKPASTSSGLHASRVRRSRDSQEVLAQEQAIVDDVHLIEDRFGPRHQLAQQEEIARELEQGERDTGKPSDAQKLAAEEEIAREVAQIEEQYGPAHEIAQQKEIAREIEQAEINAGRAEADRRFEQQREIEREIEEVERKAGLPSDAQKVEMEREIAREIQLIEAAAKRRQMAQVRTVADDIRAIVAAHLRHHHRLISSLVDSSEESKESNDDTNEVTDDDEDVVDDDPIYDDAFDNSDLVSPLGENGDDDDIASSFFSSDEATADQDVPSDAQDQVKDAPVSEDDSKTAHSSWQVTLGTVIMCSIVGVVLLIVVGAWYRDIGPLLPGKPENLILDDDEHTVYNGTTQPEPRQVGTYSPLT